MTDQPQAQIHHDTSVVQVYPTGAMICRCRICGYTIVIRFYSDGDGLAPRPKRIVLVEGDPNALHHVPFPGLSFDAMGYVPEPADVDDWPLPPALEEAIKKALGGEE